ncbi:hypothetical protein Adt_33673 [Abeliophyllum distichum]|uniref:Uncharacterized protein n=1 Tax=Abeliophyllum distichum TaxID=126358 RepID=A0ABD1QWX0_9LAMI
MRGSWSKMGSVLRLQNWCESGAKLGALGAAKLVQKLGALHQLLVKFAPVCWCNFAFDWCILHQLLAKFAPAMLVHFALDYCKFNTDFTNSAYEQITSVYI